MSTNCDHCGYRDNEVKSGAAISEKGKRITLRVEDREDLNRDILKVRCSADKCCAFPLMRSSTLSERDMRPHCPRDRSHTSSWNPGRQVHYAGGDPRTSLRRAF